MAAPQTTGMEKPEMHKMLVAAKEKPVNCAIGTGKDQSIGLLVMHKLKMGKMLEKQMIDEIPDAKNTRWGTVKIEDADPKQADFYLNRPISGMARRLIKTLKGTGFSKVRIMLEDGTAVEGAADEEEEAAATGQAAAPDAAAADAPKAAAPAPPPPPAAAKPEAPAQDAGELARRLAALAPRIPQAAAGDEARRAELLKLATQVNVNIKTNNLTYAATYLAQLAEAIETAPPAPPPAPPAAAAPKPDAAALTRQLAALIPRVAALTDPAAKAAMGKLAAEANVNIKTNNLTYAAASIAQLAKGLEAGAQAAPAAPADLAALGNFLNRLILKIPGAAGDDDALRAKWMGMAESAGKALAGGDAVRGPAEVEALRVAMAGALQKGQQEAKDKGTFEKSGREWLAARQTVEDQMEELRATIMATYEGQPVAASIDKSFRDRTAPVLRTLDASLAVKLAAANKADAAGRQKLIEEAEGILDGYKSFAATPLLADLDDNPFVPLTIRSSLQQTFGNLAAALA